MKHQNATRGKANLRPIVRDIDAIKATFRPLLIPIVREMHKLNATGFSITKNEFQVELNLSFPNTKVRRGDE
jgi:hypothetical protein